MKLNKAQLKQLVDDAKEAIGNDPDSTFSVPPAALLCLAKEALKYRKLKKRLRTLEGHASDLEGYVHAEDFNGAGLSKREGYTAHSASPALLATRSVGTINAPIAKRGR